MYLLLATYNQHKYKEMLELMPFSVQLSSLTLDPIPLKSIDETGQTYEENALIKVRTVAKYKPYTAIIADDSGLEVFELNGQPGVYSARYAGDKATDNDNIQKLLHELNGKTNRQAQFRCCIAFRYLNEEHIFEGICKGSIIEEPRGTNGFGYDPIFIPEGYHQTFAEMPQELKNKISHRAIAVQKLIQFLEENKFIYKPLQFNHSQGTTNIYFDTLSNFLHYKKDQRKVFIIDKSIYNIYNDNFKYLEEPVLLIKASEKNKSLKTVKKIFDFFYENSVDRNTNVFVIGGGVTTDMGAFATSTWKRGCRLTLIPTTAMAMVDASIGGKTAINFKHTKNLIGTFYQPEAILIDINIFNNLPQEYLEQAFAEIIKHAICFDKQYFHALLNEAKTRYAPEGIRFYVDDIKKSIEIKLNIVLQDTEEKHMRKLLNFGHTVGHAIEMAYNLPHGKALYRGMMLELKTFIKMGYCNEDVLHKLFSIYNGYFILYNYPRISFKKIKHYILQDKKINNDFIILPIIKDIGTTELLKINKSEFLKTLKLVIDETYKS